MKTLKTIGTVMMLAGMLLLLTTADGSKTQIAQMLIGLVAFCGGAYLAKAFDFQQGGTAK